MQTELEGWAAWHPKHGFDLFDNKIKVFTELDKDLTYDIKEMNTDDGTTAKTGWRAVRVKVEVV